MRFTLRKPDWRGRARRGGFLRSLLGTYPTRTEFPVNLLLVGGFRSLRSLNLGGQPVNRCVGSPTCPLTVVWLAGVGVWCGWLARTWWWFCFLGGESGHRLVVFGCGGNGQAPGWDVGDASGDSEDVSASGGSLWVIVVNTVVIGAQECQVLDVGVTACLPGDDVVDLAVISGFVTAGPRAGLGFSAQGEALFPVGVALDSVGVDGSFYWVDDGGIPDGGELMGEEFRPGHAPAVS